MDRSRSLTTCCADTTIGMSPDLLGELECTTNIIIENTKTPKFFFWHTWVSDNIRLRRRPSHTWRGAMWTLKLHNFFFFLVRPQIHTAIVPNLTSYLGKEAPFLTSNCTHRFFRIICIKLSLTVLSTSFMWHLRDLHNGSVQMHAL